MKSGRQRSDEIQARRTGKRDAARAEQARTQASRAAARLEGEVLVNPANLRPTNSYSTPDFVTRGCYVEMPFECKSCAKPQVWTATQQKWWYEAAKGDVWTIAVLCRQCRVRERDRKAAARKVHLDGIASKLAHEI